MFNLFIFITLFLITKVWKLHGSFETQVISLEISGVKHFSTQHQKQMKKISFIFFLNGLYLLFQRLQNVEAPAWNTKANDQYERSGDTTKIWKQTMDSEISYYTKLVDPFDLKRGCENLISHWFISIRGNEPTMIRWLRIGRTAPIEL